MPICLSVAGSLCGGVARFSSGSAVLSPWVIDPVGVERDFFYVRKILCVGSSTTLLAGRSAVGCVAPKELRAQFSFKRLLLCVRRGVCVSFAPMEALFVATTCAYK